MKKSGIARSVISIIVVVTVIVAAISVYAVTRPGELPPEEEEEFEILMVKAPTIGVGATPIVTLVAKNTTDEGIIKTYTLRVDGEAVETKSFIIEPGETESLPFILDPFQEAGDHTVNIAGVTETLSIKEGLIYWEGSNKVYTSFEGERYAPYGPEDAEVLTYSEVEAMIEEIISEGLLEEFKDNGGVTCAVVFHDLGTTLGAITVGVLNRIASDYGIHIISMLSASWDTERMISQLETIAVMKPDYCILMATDPDAVADVVQNVLKPAGVKMVHSDMCTRNEPDDSYVGVGGSDYAGFGLASVERMAQMLRMSTKEPPYEILDIFMAIEFHPVNVRNDMLYAYVEDHPDLKIVDSIGFTDPYEVQAKVEAKLPLLPDLDAIFTPWTDPGQGGWRAAMGLGRTDIIHCTCDMEEFAIMEFANPDPPYLSLGFTNNAEEVMIWLDMIVLDAIEGYEAPKYGVSEAHLITRANCLEMYKWAWANPLGIEVPVELSDLLSEEEDLP